MLRSAGQRERSWSSAIVLALAIGLPAVFTEAAVIFQDRVRAGEIGAISYTDQVRAAEHSLAGQLAEGVRVRVQEFGRLLVPGMYKAVARRGDWLNVNMLVYVPLAVAVMWGWCRLVRQRADIFAGLFPFYLALYIIWPYDQGARFFVPLAPLLAVSLGFLIRAGSVSDGAFKKPSLTLPARTDSRLFGIGLAVAHLLVAIVYWQFDDRRNAVRYNADRESVQRLIDGIPTSQRAAVAVPEKSGLSPGWAEYYLDRLPPTWGTYGLPPAEARWLLAPADEEPPATFVLTATAGRFRLYQRDGSSTSRAQASDR
jgi:hypothetical protein